MQTVFRKNTVLLSSLKFSKPALIILTVLFFAYPNFSQTVNDSSLINQIDRNSFSTGFDKQLNTYNFNSSFILNRNFKKMNFTITERFNSTFIKSEIPNIKDEQFLRAGTEYSFSKKFKMGITAVNNIFSDDRRIAINQASVLNSYLYSKIKISDEVNLNPFFGFSQNTQIGQTDKGILFGSEATVFKNFNDDLILDSYLKYFDENISPRKNTDHAFNLSLTNYFDNNISNILSLSLLQSRKDFYFAADSFVIRDFGIKNNVQSRTESYYKILNKFVYPEIIKNVTFSFDGGAHFRMIDRQTKYRSLNFISPAIFDVDVNELRLEFESAADYVSKIFSGRIGFIFSEREENYRPNNFDVDNIFIEDEKDKAFETKERQESQKNNISNRATLNFTGSLNLSEDDLLIMNFSQNKLRYDTPSELNFDDRDEVLSFFRLQYFRKMNPFFTFFTGSELSINHTVYIFAERSSNNNIKRILKFNAGGDYAGKNFRSKNEFSVSANYTVYDFEDLIPNIRSFSYRQLYYQDSTSLRLFKNIFVTAIAYSKISEQGDFRWNNFTGKPMRDLYENYLEPKLVNVSEKFNYGAGIRVLSLKTFSHRAKIVEKESDYFSIGPVAEFNIYPSKNLLVSLKGNYEFIKSNDNKRQQTTLNIRMLWEL